MTPLGCPDCLLIRYEAHRTGAASIRIIAPSEPAQSTNFFIATTFRMNAKVSFPAKLDSSPYQTRFTPSGSEGIHPPFHRAISLLPVFIPANLSPVIYPFVFSLDLNLYSTISFDRVIQQFFFYNFLKLA